MCITGYIRMHQSASVLSLNFLFVALSSGQMRYCILNYSYRTAVECMHAKQCILFSNWCTFLTFTLSLG